MRKIAIVSAAILLAACASMKQDTSMSFFITSVNPGKGGDLGGLAGADAYCQKLAASAGHGGKTWHAYLSTASANARDRIGKGPWYNAKGVMVAANVDDLHGAGNRIDKQTGLDEKGGAVNGYGDSPNRHDILTGSTADGKLSQGATCNDWTASTGNTAMVGHFDRAGTNPDPMLNKSWNASHKTRGCSLPELAMSGSAGLMYCFAAN